MNSQAKAISTLVWNKILVGKTQDCFLNHLVLLAEYKYRWDNTAERLKRSAKQNKTKQIQLIPGNTETQNIYFFFIM